VALMTPLAERAGHFSSALQRFERDPESIAQQRHYHVGLDAWLQLMEQGPNR
jgi:hypothetical protein